MTTPRSQMPRPGGHAQIQDGYTQIPNGHAQIPDSHAQIPNTTPRCYAQIQNGHTQIPDSHAQIPDSHAWICGSALHPCFSPQCPGKAGSVEARKSLPGPGPGKPTSQEGVMRIRSVCLGFEFSLSFLCCEAGAATLLHPTPQATPAGCSELSDPPLMGVSE